MVFLAWEAEPRTVSTTSEGGGVVALFTFSSSRSATAAASSVALAKAVAMSESNSGEMSTLLFSKLGDGQAVVPRFTLSIRYGLSRKSPSKGPASTTHMGLSILSSMQRNRDLPISFSLIIPSIILLSSSIVVVKLAELWMVFLVYFSKFISSFWILYRGMLAETTALTRSRLKIVSHLLLAGDNHLRILVKEDLEVAEDINEHLDRLWHDGNKMCHMIEKANMGCWGPLACDECAIGLYFGVMAERGRLETEFEAINDLFTTFEDQLSDAVAEDSDYVLKYENEAGPSVVAIGMRFNMARDLFRQDPHPSAASPTETTAQARTPAMKLQVSLKPETLTGMASPLEYAAWKRKFNYYVDYSNARPTLILKGKTLRKIEIGDRVRIQDFSTKRWNTIGHIQECLRDRRYLVKSDKGRLYKRNRRFLWPVNAPVEAEPEDGRAAPDAGP
eukprot:snap_masked-scaffold1255_size84902-processed-gene-0.7 protein:Tk08542 transcript:snap_masked-scaffold1255_size84902-processed-gene-0.7-mRNA-1 annotation:"hypothetical protein DAPPUDRAFT_112167"